MSGMHLGRSSLASIAVRWILANVLPQAFLIAATWAYLSVRDITAAELIVPGGVFRLPHPYWLAVAAGYIVMTVWMRGAVLRPLVPRFSIPGWVAAAVLTSLLMLALTVGGSLIGLAVSKGLAVSHRPPFSVPVPAGLLAVPFILGAVIGGETIGVVSGALPGLLVGVIEALVVGRATYSIGTWTLWTAAAWSMIFTIILFHIVLVVVYPSVSHGILTAIAGPMPILFGIVAALATLPAVAKLAAAQSHAG